MKRIIILIIGIMLSLHLTSQIINVKTKGGYFAAGYTKSQPDIIDEGELHLRAGRVLNGNFTIWGLAVSGSFNNQVHDKFFDQASVYSARCMFFSEVILLQHVKFLHVSFPFMIGANKDFYYIHRQNTQEYMDDCIGVIAKAGIELDIHLLPNVTISPAVYYATQMYTEDMFYKFEGESNRIRIEQNYFQPMTLGVTLKLGGFGRYK